MATCSASELMADAGGFASQSSYMLQVLSVTLLAKLLKERDPMADVTASGLMADSCQFNCLSEGLLQVLQAQLLCEILQADKAIYGSCFAYEEENPAITINAVSAGTYYPITGFVAGPVRGAPWLTLGDTVFTIGESGGGVYHVEAQLSIEANKQSIIHIDVIKNNTHSGYISSDNKIASPADQRLIAMSGFLTLALGDTVEMHVKSTAANTAIGIRHATFNIQKIGAS